MNVRTIALSLVMLLAIPAAVPAAGPAQSVPHWSVEVKGGYFYPDIENWKDLLRRRQDMALCRISGIQDTQAG